MLVASLGVQMLTAHVRVLGAAEVPTTVTLSPLDTAIAPGGTVTFTASLDLPAATPTAIALSVNPANAGTLPATVTVATNQLSATFTYTDASTTGSATVTALSRRKAGDDHGVTGAHHRDQRGRLRSGRHRRRRVRRDLQPVGDPQPLEHVADARRGADNTVAYATVDL
jgi:hypothetical protein